MSRTLLLLLIALGLAPVAVGQSTYELSIDEGKAKLRPREEGGRTTYYYTIPFRIQRGRDQTIVTDVPADEIRVKEDGRLIERFELHQPKIDKLTTVLAFDISGSMDRESPRSRRRKMDEAKRAAQLYLDRLDARADTGLVLFDHLLRQRIPPARQPEQFAIHRQLIRRHIAQAKPQGGTAYLDAIHESVAMTQGIKGKRAVVVMTDGMDVNSTRTLEEAVAFAKEEEVPVYTIGVGEPREDREVHSVLVLDCSASMARSVGVSTNVSKMDALKSSANGFIDLMGPHAKATVLPFSTRVEKAGRFTSDHKDLKARVASLRPLNETALYEAISDGINTLVASEARTNRYLVVLTDGQNTTGTLNKEAVIDEANRWEIPLHLIGFGRRSDIDEEGMREMAERTGGKYYHARDQKQLFDVFEAVSTILHGEGIDEASLRRIASETGGSYHRAADASDLDLIYTQLADELQSTYTVTFPSLNPRPDGSVSGIDIYIERDGQVLSNLARTDLARPGLVVAEMSYGTYLVLLSILLVLLAVPSGVRRLHRFYGGR